VSDEVTARGTVRFRGMMLDLILMSAPQERVSKDEAACPSRRRFAPPQDEAENQIV
jgi:hypothetical protein